MRRTSYSAILLLILCVSLVFYFSQQGQPRTTMLGGVTWTEVLYWSFKDGLYPDGWGWGNWSIVDGVLEGRESEGAFSVYFFPFTHGGDFVLETRFMFIKGLNSDVEVQLLTRDSCEINFESGMVLFAGRSEVTMRHTANKIDYVYRPFSMNLSIDYGEWYVMRFMIHSGTVRLFVNETQVCVSNESYPVGEYHEPHLAVRYTVARFEYFKVFVLSG